MRNFLIKNKILTYRSKVTIKIKNNESFIEWLDNTDLESLRKWRNEQKNILRQNKNITAQEQKKYFNSFYKKNCLDKNPKNILFAFKVKKNLIGYGGFVNISWKNKRAEISFLLKTSIAKNKKLYEYYFKKFFLLINKISFSNLGFNKIYTETFVFRKKHIKLLEKYGFKKEGLFLNHYYKNKKKINSIVHAKYK